MVKRMRIRAPPPHGFEGGAVAVTSLPVYKQPSGNTEAQIQPPLFLWLIAHFYDIFKVVYAINTSISLP